MTPQERIGHIRQCLQLMRPVMGYEVAAVAEIERSLAALAASFDQLHGFVEKHVGDNSKALEEMVRAALAGDTCG